MSVTSDGDLVLLPTMATMSVTPAAAAGVAVTAMATAGTPANNSKNLAANIPQVSLEFILDTFKSNISQEQAWALIYQSTKTLNQLLTSEYEMSRRMAAVTVAKTGTKDKAISATGASTGTSTGTTANSNNTVTSELSLKKLTSFSQIIIDINGNVTASTWLATKSKTDNGGNRGAGNGHTFIVIKNGDDKRLMNESINTLIASLATMVYTALEWNWRQPSPSSTAAAKRCCNNDNEQPGNNHRHTAEEIFKCQTVARNDNGDDDDDEELDLEESLELLMLAMLRGSENKDLVDEGYIDALEESCLHSVLVKCQSHFDELIAATDDHHHHHHHHHDDDHDDDHHHQPPQNPPVDKMKMTNNNNAILEMLASSNVNKLGADYYYRTVCKMMVDEALKLNKLVKQFCDRTNGVERYNHQAAKQNEFSSTENLKIWAQTWIKVMSEMRFGVLLRPVSARRIEKQPPAPPPPLPSSPSSLVSAEYHKMNLRHRLSSLKSVKTLHRYYSLPIVSQDSIQERLKNLKPATSRKIRDRPVEPPCLHERLMTAIRQFDRCQLRHTETRVKPVIRDLYLREKQRRKKECRSLWNLNDGGGGGKRKTRTPDGKQQRTPKSDSKNRPSLGQHYDFAVCSEISLNKLWPRNDPSFVNNKKYKRTLLPEYHLEQFVHHSNLRASTPKLGSYAASSSDFSINHSPFECGTKKNSFDDDVQSGSIGLTSYQSLSLVTSGGHQESSYCIVDSLRATATTNASRSQNFFSSSNPYLRRSFVRKSDHHRHQHHRATQDAPSISIQHQSPSSLEDDDDDVDVDDGNKIFPPRTSLVRRSFRSSLNVVWCRFFGTSSAPKNDNLLKKQV